MLRQTSTTLTIATPGRGLHEITREVAGWRQLGERMLRQLAIRGDLAAEHRQRGHARITRRGG